MMYNILDVMSCLDMVPKGLNIQMCPIPCIWAISAHGPKWVHWGKPWVWTPTRSYPIVFMSKAPHAPPWTGL